MEINKAEEVLREIEKEASKQERPVLGIHGRARPVKFLPIIGPVKGELLEKMIRENKPKRVLEIGTLVGYSAILMAKNMKKGRIISLEIDKNAAEIARQNIERAGLSDRVEIIVGDAKKTIKKLEGKFDLVFIDAAKEEYLNYLKLAEPKMAKGTIVVADNAKVFAGEMQDYLDYVRNSGTYKSKFYDFGFDGVEVSLKL